MEVNVSWKIEGSYFETCSCDLICPCTASLALGATNDYCRAMLVFNVKDGDVNGTDVRGRTVAAVADTPKVMSDGNWRLGVFIDDKASDEQAEALGGVFSRALGGPVGALGPPGGGEPGGGRGGGAGPAGGRDPRPGGGGDRRPRGRPRPLDQGRRLGRLRDRGRGPVRL